MLRCSPNREDPGSELALSFIVLAESAETTEANGSSNSLSGLGTARGAKSEFLSELDAILTEAAAREYDGRLSLSGAGELRFGRFSSSNAFLRAASAAAMDDLDTGLLESAEVEGAELTLVNVEAPELAEALEL